MAHNCKALLLHCMDFRLGPAIKEFMESRGLLGDADIVSVAGATKDLEYILKQISLSANLHHISTVILMNHTDCGGYGGHKAFPSSEEERQAHIQDMQTARKRILEKYPDLKVELFLAEIDGDNQVSIKAV